MPNWEIEQHGDEQIVVKRTVIERMTLRVGSWVDVRPTKARGLGNEGKIIAFSESDVVPGVMYAKVALRKTDGRRVAIRPHELGEYLIPISDILRHWG